MPEFRLKTKDRWVGGKFVSDVDPNNAAACIALLRSIAATKRVKPADAVLVTWVGSAKTPREYRTT